MSTSTIKAGEKSPNSVRVDNRFTNFSKINESIFKKNRLKLESINFSGSLIITDQFFPKREKEVLRFSLDDGTIVKQIVNREVRERMYKSIRQNAEVFFKAKPFYEKEFASYTMRLDKLEVRAKQSDNIYQIKNIKNKATVSKMNGECVSKITEAEYLKLLDDFNDVITQQCYFKNGYGPTTCAV